MQRAPLRPFISTSPAQGSDSSADDSSSVFPEPSPPTEGLMSGGDATGLASPPPLRRDSRHDIRSLVRLIQCSQCSYPYRTPVTLPCGNSVCRQCLPPAHIRENVSYPDLPSRAGGITCPFGDCRKVHALGDCSVDVVLLKVMESIASEVAKQKTNVAGGRPLLLEEVIQFDEDATTDREGLAPASSEKAHSRTLSGGKLVATYTFAEMGELHYTSDVTYHSTGEAEEDGPSMDEDFVGILKDTTHDKVDCHVCYNMLLEPITTPCGHSFCRKCLARILDHSTLCPHCRRTLSLPRDLTRQLSNKTLSGILSSLYPDDLAARIETQTLEEQSTPNGLNTALFVCTVAFPQMPVILHIFEPRYRLMVRRALESNRQFGMLPYNEHGRSQGQLGHTQFMETGTMLHIDQCQVQEDGRSFLICRGLYRFKVQAHGVLDGYTVGRVQRHDDLAVQDEERIESEETSGPAADAQDLMAQIDHMPTSELFAECQAFLQRAQAQSARWLQGNIQTIYGEPPDDPALFPYWFASVVPLQDDAKYKLLPTTTVRERLKITLKWIKKIEAQRWSDGDSESESHNDDDDDDE